MTSYVVGLMTAVIELSYAIGSILALYSATSIYIKINAGEEGFLKSVYILIGSVLFLLFASAYLPSFFGFTPFRASF